MHGGRAERPPLPSAAGQVSHLMVSKAHVPGTLDRMCAGSGLSAGRRCATSVAPALVVGMRASGRARRSAVEGARQRPLRVVAGGADVMGACCGPRTSSQSRATQEKWRRDAVRALSKAETCSSVARMLSVMMRPREHIACAVAPRIIDLRDGGNGKGACTRQHGLRGPQGARAPAARPRAAAAASTLACSMCGSPAARGRRGRRPC